MSHSRADLEDLLFRRGFVKDDKGNYVPRASVKANAVAPKVKVVKSNNVLSEPKGNRIYLKPVSQNQAWLGRRYPSKIYAKFKVQAAKMLPNIKLPKPPYELHYKFGFSSTASDIDNCLKSCTDSLAAKYGFNDRLIHRLVVDKEIVPKGKDYFEFTILHYGN